MRTRNNRGITFSIFILSYADRVACSFNSFTLNNRFLQPICLNSAIEAWLDAATWATHSAIQANIIFCFSQILSGDSVVLREEPRGGPPPERQIVFSNITAPKLARPARGPNK